MDARIYRSRLIEIGVARRGVALCLLLSLIVNAFLTWSLVQRFADSRVVLLPPRIERPFTLTGGEYSIEYYQQLSSWLAAQLLTYTPETYRARALNFLRYVDGEARAQLRKRFDNDYREVKRFGESSVFHVSDIKVKEKGVEILGQLTRWQGNNISYKGPWSVRFLFSFRQDGLIRVRSVDQEKA